MRASYFYGAEVDSVDFSNIKNEVATRVNKLASSQSSGLVTDLVRDEDSEDLDIQSPLAVVAGNFFQGRFSERPFLSSLNYINLPRGRRLVPVDSLAWSGAFNAGYEPELDCTAVRQPSS